MSTESILSTIHLTLSPPALDSERCPSPSSTRAMYTTSRPNSYNEFEAPFNYGALADLADIRTPGEVVQHSGARHGSIRSQMSQRSTGTSTTCRSRAVRRSDAAQNLPVVEDVDEGYEGPVDESMEKGKGKERAAGEKKSWATSSKKWKRAMSQLFSSAKENAGILDRSGATTTLTAPTSTPAATFSQRTRQQRAPSLFQFARPRTVSIASKKTTAGGTEHGRAAFTNHSNASTLNFRNLTVDTVAARKARNQRVRRSRSFSGFAGIDLGSSPDAEVASPSLMGQFNVHGFPQVVDSPVPLDEEEEMDGLDDVTREATAVSRSVGAEWGYVDEE